MKNYKIDLHKAVSEKASLDHVSMKVQKHAIKLGCQWGNERPQEPQYLPSRYLFITGIWLAHAKNMKATSFQEHPNELISVEDFLLIQPEHEGIKMTKQEAQIRMIKGECPTLEAFTFYFDEQSNRFMHHTEERTIQGEIQGFWNELDKWYWPVTFEQSGEYEICWVSDESLEERAEVDIVRLDSETGKYCAKTGVTWKYATPVETKDCWRHKR